MDYKFIYFLLSSSTLFNYNNVFTLINIGYLFLINNVKSCVNITENVRLSNLILAMHTKQTHKHILNLTLVRYNCRVCK